MKPALLTNLLIKELQRVLDAQSRAVEALASLSETAFSPELRCIFLKYAEEMQNRRRRLEEIFRSMKIPSAQKGALGMTGMIEQANGLLAIKNDADTAVLDAALIVAAQKMAHYELACDSSARGIAAGLGLQQISALLGEMLQEGAETDRLLTTLANNEINPVAAEADKQIQTGAPAQ